MTARPALLLGLQIVLALCAALVGAERTGKVISCSG